MSGHPETCPVTWRTDVVLKALTGADELHQCSEGAGHPPPCRCACCNGLFWFHGWIPAAGQP